MKQIKNNNLRASAEPEEKAFTLIEILTGLVVIAILATLLLPALNSSLESSRTSKCVSNLRQIGVGIFAYASDNDGNLPVQYWWTESAAPPALSRGGQPNGLGFIAPYFGVQDPHLGLGVKPKVFDCPSGPSHYFFTNSDIPNWCSYVYQSPNTADNGATATNLPNKSTICTASNALVADVAQIWGDRPSPHKGNKVNVLYGDGSVETVPAWMRSDKPDKTVGVYLQAFNRKL
jgi:prepilin-type N-terminal cleavage/methylation domain-containing protein/prepilin-type processing-associated H-X9-DG protein